MEVEQSLKGNRLAQCGPFVMPAYTYQVALKDQGQWQHDYVCAKDRTDAVNEYLKENPYMTLDRLLHSEAFEVERCE